MSRSSRPEGGQILVLFGLLLVGMVAMVGLVIDGGSTYAMRRGEQKAADLAALAGADALINGLSADTAARAVATANGYTTNATTTVTVTTNVAAATVKVDISAPHRNGFAGVIPGQASWQVSVTATAQAGVPAGSLAAAPIIFSSAAFGPDGLPLAAYGCSDAQIAAGTCVSASFGDGNGDVPNNAGDVAWTLYGPNVNTNSVRPYLAGTQIAPETFAIGDYIGQSNGGFHNALFGDGTGVADPSQCDGGSAHTNVDTCLSGKDVVVPIVSPIGTTCVHGGSPGGGGCFEGWALFHVVSAEGKSTKAIEGYFVSGISRNTSSEDLCTQADLTTCPGFHGLYSLKLID